MSAENLCLACGLCCDGTVFADVKLSATDWRRLAPCVKRTKPDSDPVPKLLLNARSLRQPCPAFAEGKCGIYKFRPGHCRNFDCALLQSVHKGKIQTAAALEVIKACKRKAAKVRVLLRKLGDEDEDVSVMRRFRRTVRRCERDGCDHARSELLGKLTLAAHALNRALAWHIYP